MFGGVWISGGGISRLAQAHDLPALGASQHRFGLVWDNTSGEWLVGVTQRFDSGVAASPFAIDFGGSTFNGVFDPTMIWGYNVTDGGAQINASDASVFWAIETNYRTNAIYGGVMHNFGETHFNVTGVNGVNRRFMGFSADRDDPDQYGTWSIAMAPNNSAINFVRADTYAAIYTFSVNGQFKIFGSAPQIVFGVANPVIQTDVNTPIALITNGKYVWISNTLEGLHFGSAKDTSLYRTGTNQLSVGGRLMLDASTTVRASVNVPSGTAPTSPVDGDVWSDGSNLLVRLGGVTYTLTKS